MDVPVSVTGPVEILEVLSPVVVSTMMFAAIPLVLATSAIVPFRSISLFDIKLILEPFAPVTVPAR